jgi:hypothetical protein
MLKEFRMDLHIHTCLSPCGDNSMVPPTIIQRALGAGLQGIAICDHNSAANVLAVRTAGAEAGLGVVVGMEVSTAEEIHLLALFDGDFQVNTFADLVKAHLPGVNDPQVFGDQIIVDRHGNPVALEEALLIGAVDLEIGRIVEEIHRLDGLAIPRGQAGVQPPQPTGFHPARSWPGRGGAVPARRCPGAVPAPRPPRGTLL